MKNKFFIPLQKMQENFLKWLSIQKRFEEIKGDFKDWLLRQKVKEEMETAN